ncbi:MAG: hypothetical protein KDD64_13700 [Bdellovibrionales bacterium]|nr:hypothetical protein [Bdellovibrionales bacterium]
MTPALGVVLLVFLGSLIQGALLLRNVDRVLIMIGIALCSLVGLFGGDEETPYVLAKHVETCLLFFYIGFSIVFVHWLMPVINERVLLLHTVTFLYLVERFYWHYVEGYPFVALIFVGLPAVGILVGTCTPLRLSFRQRLGAYVWYLLVSIAFVVSEFVASDLSRYYENGIDSIASLIQVLSAGMAMLFLSANVFYVLSFIPFRYKEQSYPERVEEIKRYANFVVGKYSDEQFSFWQMLILLGVQLGVLLANRQWGLVNDWIVINLVIVGTSLLIPVQDKKKMVLPKWMPVEELND